MSNYTHQTAPTQFVEAKGTRFAYRRFGKAGGVPLVFNQHYLGTMDYWDPTVTDGLARDREVILTKRSSLIPSEWNSSFRRKRKSWLTMRFRRLSLNGTKRR